MPELRPVGSHMTELPPVNTQEDERAALIRQIQADDVEKAQLIKMLTADDSPEPEEPPEVTRAKEFLAENPAVRQDPKDFFPEVTGTGEDVQGFGVTEKDDGFTKRDRLAAAMQGATWGISDEAGVAMAALYDSISTGSDFGKTYDVIKDYEANRRQQFMGKHPSEAIASMVAGGFATGGGVAALGKQGAQLGGKVLAKAAPKTTKKIQEAALNKSLEKLATTKKIQEASLKKSLAEIAATTKAGAATFSKPALEAQIAARAAEKGGWMKKAAKYLVPGALGGGVAGFAGTEGGFGERAEGAEAGALLGGLARPAIDAVGKPARALVNAIGSRKIAQELGKGPKAIPLNVADPEGKLGKTYKFLGAAHSLGDDVTAQTERTLGRVREEVALREIASSDAAKKISGLRAGTIKPEHSDFASEVAARELSDTLSDIRAPMAGKRASIEKAATANILKNKVTAARDLTSTQNRLTESIKLARRSAQAGQKGGAQGARQGMYAHIYEAATPPGSTVKVSAKAHPQEAVKAFKADWDANGFPEVKGRDYARDFDAEIEGIINELEGGRLDDFAPRIRALLEHKIKPKLVNGRISGEDLMEARNTLRREAATSMEPNAVRSRAAMMKGVDRIDKILESGMSKDEVASFAGRKSAWGEYQSLVALTGQKNPTGGDFSPEEYLKQQGRTRKYAAATGDVPGQKQARTAQKGLAEGDVELEVTLEKLAEANKAEGAAAKESISATRDRIGGQLKESKKLNLGRLTDAENERTRAAIEAADRTKAHVKRAAKRKGTTLKTDPDLPYGRAKATLAGLEAGKTGVMPPDSPFQKLLASAIVGAPMAVPAQIMGAGPAGVIAAGTAGSAYGSRQATQRFLAGQTGFQKTLAALLRKYDDNRAITPMLRGGGRGAERAFVLGQQQQE